MSRHLGAVFPLANRQHSTFATWQLRAWGWDRDAIRAAVRGRRRLFRGVYAWDGDITTLGWLMAAVLAQGKGAALSHVTALRMHRLLPWEADQIHVSAVGRGKRTQRDGIVVHRPRRAFEPVRRHGIPTTDPTRALKDADLPRYLLYRALEEAEKRRYQLTLPLDAVVRTKQAAKGHTRSPAEAEALLVMAEHGITLPLVNHRVNGIEADFHWPSTRTVLGIDGWEWHNERPQFEEDRRRELVHAAAGWQVVRASATQVFATPELLVRAVAPSVL